MCSSLRFLSFLLLSLGLVCARPAKASHADAGTLTYVSLGNNNYRVRVDYLRDCAGIAAPTSFLLYCTTSCGSTSRTATLVVIGQPVIGTPYSSTVQPSATCPLTGPAPYNAPANFAAYRYEGTITLPANQWILSVEENFRPSTANVSSGDLRLEATLDNRGRTNNSVTYSVMPTIFFPVNQSNLTQIGAFDVDGDSLSYSLERPLTGCGTYETYAPYPSSCLTQIDPRCPTRIINCANAPSTYTQFLPVAVGNDTIFENGNTVRPACPTNSIVSATVQPHFSFAATQGVISFTPNRYLNTNPAIGDNKYMVVVKVTEWRRENGVYVVVGTTRRDMMWIICDGTNATLPRIAPTVTVQNGLQTSTQPLTTSIAVQAGEHVSVNLSATTTGTTPLVFTLEQNTVPGAVIQAGATAGTGRLTFTPPLSLPNGTYRVSVTVTDDASPLRNIITVPVTFHVYRTALATRAASVQTISAYPTPFTEQVQFQLPTTGVQALTVHDQLGRVVARLTSQADGKVQWTPSASVPAGLYSARSADGKLTVRLLRSTAQ